jgi:hypothetical protein
MPNSVEAFRFDIAFSFAGPHRDKVLAIAELVAADLGKERVFFDEWYEHEILGADMDVLLQRFYRKQSLFVVADLSDEYADRPWCQAEAQQSASCASKSMRLAMKLNASACSTPASLGEPYPVFSRPMRTSTA